MVCFLLMCAMRCMHLRRKYHQALAIDLDKVNTLGSKPEKSIRSAHVASEGRVAYHPHQGCLASLRHRVL